MNLGLITVLVRDYDEAIDYFCGKLGFALIENKSVSESKRWVVVSTGLGTSLLLAKAATSDQSEQIGKAAGGRVAYFLYVEDFNENYARLRKRGVRFLEEVRDEPYGKVVKFLDLYGNKWDLIEEPPAN